MGPTVVCGQVISTAPEGVVVHDASSADVTIGTGSVGAYVYVRVAAGCEHGAAVTVDPSAAASVVRTATAADGKPAAVVLNPLRTEFDVHLLRADGSRSTVHVRLPAW